MSTAPSRSEGGAPNEHCGGRTAGRPGVLWMRLPGRCRGCPLSATTTCTWHRTTATTPLRPMGTCCTSGASPGSASPPVLAVCSCPTATTACIGGSWSRGPPHAALHVSSPCALERQTGLCLHCALVARGCGPRDVGWIVQVVWSGMEVWDLVVPIAVGWGLCLFASGCHDTRKLELCGTRWRGC